MDDFFFGLRLETSASARSTNVTFGDDAGPFGKTSDAINVGQLYVGYRGIRDVTLTAGRMPNPFVTTSMVWDGDINPEGLAQQYKHTFNLTFGGGSAAAADYSKDGKGAAPAISEPYKMSIEVFANFGQFVYDDSNPENVDRRSGRRRRTPRAGERCLSPRLSGRREVQLHQGPLPAPGADDLSLHRLRRLL